MRNNNQAIVRKIARRSLAVNHGRNAFHKWAVLSRYFSTRRCGHLDIKKARKIKGFSPQK